MFVESLQVMGNERCTLTLIPVGSKWSLSQLCIITCPVDCTHADIANCVGANRGLHRQSAQSISVDTQDEHKKRKETGLKGKTKPDLTNVLISILDGSCKVEFQDLDCNTIIKTTFVIPRTNVIDDYLRMIEQSYEVLSSLYISHPGLRLNPGPHHQEARLNAQFYTYSKVGPSVDNRIEEGKIIRPGCRLRLGLMF
nr:cytochrome P450 82A2 [Tanacetum cinerariifolium]